MIIEIDEQAFVEHVKRICRTNIRKPCQICLSCPFREHVLEVMRRRGWKLPAGEKR